MFRFNGVLLFVLTVALIYSEVIKEKRPTVQLSQGVVLGVIINRTIVTLSNDFRLHSSIERINTSFNTYMRFIRRNYKCTIVRNK